MMHEQVEDQEIIERYVRNQLAAEERQAFEEHFFACEECFGKLQATERFVAGVRDAAKRGLLPAVTELGEVPGRMASWWLTAFGVTALATVLLAAGAGWLYFVQMPRLRGQLSQFEAELRRSKEVRVALEEQLAKDVQAEVDVPLVMLQATRDMQTPPAEAILPRQAARLILWIDVPSGRFRSYRLEISDANARRIATLEHLTRNSYRALAASVPVKDLPPGEFRIKLSGEQPPPASLLAEYRLRIRKP